MSSIMALKIGSEGEQGVQGTLVVEDVMANEWPGEVMSETYSRALLLTKVGYHVRALRHYQN